MGILGSVWRTEAGRTMGPQDITYERRGGEDHYGSSTGGKMEPAQEFPLRIG